MSLKIAFQMDPITAVDIDADTTFRLAEEAQLRGHKVYYYHPENLLYNDGRVIALGNEIKIDRNLSTPVILESEITIDLSRDIDIVWLRQDPPFDMEYINNTYVLEAAEKEGVKIFNKPSSLRSFNEKISILEFSEFCTETIVTSDKKIILKFINKYLILTNTQVSGKQQQCRFGW